MRFVVPETRKIDLKDGPDGEKNWIEVKKELSKAEDAAFRTRGFRGMTQATGNEKPQVEIDWAALALARVEAYLVDWSATDAKGKAMKPTPANIGALDDESFTEIDEAIQRHIDEVAEGKKGKGGN